MQTSCSQGHAFIKPQHHMLLFNNSSNINRHWENRAGLPVMSKVNMTCTIRPQILFVILQRQSSKSLTFQIPLLHSTKMSSSRKQNDNVHVPVLSQLMLMLKLGLILHCSPSYWIDLFYLIDYFYRMCIWTLIYILEE